MSRKQFQVRISPCLYNPMHACTFTLGHHFCCPATFYSFQVLAHSYSDVPDRKNIIGMMVSLSLLFAGCLLALAGATGHQQISYLLVMASERITP